MRGMTITCVMPNHNHARFLRQSLGGVLGQIRPADEIIVIDDGSTDDSLSVIEEMQREAPNLRLIRQSARQGVVSSLNRGLREARGELVAFLGADDMVLPAFLQRTATLVESHPQAGFATGRVEIWNAQGNRRGVRPILMPSTTASFISPAAYRRLLDRGDNHFSGCATLYRRDLLAELGGFDPSLGSMSDGVVARRMAARAGFGFVPEILGIWRIHGENYSVTSMGDAQQFEAITRRAQQVLRSEPRDSFPPKYDELFVRRVRFGAARLLLVSARTKPTSEVHRYLGRMTGFGPGWMAGLMAGIRLGRMGRAAALLLLAARLRPFSISALAVEPLRRHWVERRARRGR